jgi:hypothetical protein
MNTRCKPDSLAWISRSANPSEIGMVVRVVELDSAWSAGAGLPVWNVAFDGIAISKRGSVLVGEASIADECLTPISDPSLEDEARDELKVKEPA